MDTPPRPRNFFRYLAIGMCHFRHLWNGMCDRHRAEITGAVHRSLSSGASLCTARWGLHLVPYYQSSSPMRSLPITGHWDVSLPPSLEWHVWSSSSGNNCHAVHRSLSSGASLCDGTVRFFTLSHIVSQAVFYTTYISELSRCNRWLSTCWLPRWIHQATFSPSVMKIQRRQKGRRS